MLLNLSRLTWGAEFRALLDHAGLVHLDDDERSVDIASAIRVASRTMDKLGVSEELRRRALDQLATLETTTPLQAVMQANVKSGGGDMFLKSVTTTVGMSLLQQLPMMNRDMLVNVMRDPKTAQKLRGVLRKGFEGSSQAGGGAADDADDLTVATRLASKMQGPASAEVALTSLQAAFADAAGQTGGASVAEVLERARHAPAADHVVALMRRRFDGAAVGASVQVLPSPKSGFAVLVIDGKRVEVRRQSAASSASKDVKVADVNPELVKLTDGSVFVNERVNRFGEVFDWMHTVAAVAIVVYWVMLLAMLATLKQRQADKDDDGRYDLVEDQLERSISDAWQLVALVLVVDLQAFSRLLDALTGVGAVEGEVSEDLRGVAELMPTIYSALSAQVFLKAYKDLGKGLAGFWRKTISPVGVDGIAGGGASSEASSAASSASCDTASNGDCSSEEESDALSTCLDELDQLCGGGGGDGNAPVGFFQEARIPPAAASVRRRRAAASGYRSGGSSSEVSFAAE